MRISESLLETTLVDQDDEVEDDEVVGDDLEVEVLVDDDEIVEVVELETKQ